MIIAETAAIVNALNSGGSPTPTPAAGGWDFVIKVESGEGPNTYSLVSGDFDAVAAKIQNYEPINAYFQNVSTDFQTNGQYGWFRDAFFDGEVIVLSVWVFFDVEGIWRPSYGNLVWSPDGEIFED